MNDVPLRPVYVAGRALASSLGPDLPAALATLRAGPVRPGRFDGQPYHAIAGDEPFEACVRRIATQSGALAGSRRGPLLVASSSFDIAEREAGRGEGDYAACADRVAGWLDWQGPVFTVSTACTSAVNALLSAHALIAHGQADAALVLGLERRNHTSLGGFMGLQLLSPTHARPLAADRDGLVLGEAVAALHLTAAPARWRLRGGANVIDGRDPAGIVPQAVHAMCREALRHSGLRIEEVDLIKLQAAGSVTNDAAELDALSDMFSPLPALLSLKAWLGHTLGAAGAAEIALLTACLEAGEWPAAESPRLVAAPPPRCRHVLATILGFGGGHAAVALQDTAA